jgi:hypothetical protein
MPIPRYYMILGDIEFLTLTYRMMTGSTVVAKLRSKKLQVMQTYSVGGMAS